ncbi:MAG: hypothetical protein HN531_12020 [Opitutae bacterium]|nr:hypothetical protein [Opitutae bacterium]
MKPILGSLFSFFLLLGFSDGLFAGTKLLDRIPGDSLLVVSVDDWSDFSEKIEDGPFGLFSKSPAWSKMNEWMEDQLESGFGEKEAALEEMIEQMKDWRDSFDGGMAMSMGGFEKMLGALSDGTKLNDLPPPTVVFLMETEKTDKDLVKTLRWMKKEVKRTGGNFGWDRSKVEGTEVHWIGNNKSKDNEKAAVFVKDQILHLIFGGEEPVREALFLGAGDISSKAISDNDQYLDLFDEIGEGDARLFMNFKPLVAMMEKLVEDPKFELPENPFGMKTEVLMEALGLDSMDCFGVQIDPSDETLSLSSAFFVTKYDGIFSLMEDDGKKANLHPFVPSSLMSASSARYDLSKLWPKMEEMMREMSPQLLLLVNSQIQAFEDQIGVPFRKNVLGSLGDDIVSFSRLNTDWAKNVGRLFSDDDELDELDVDGSPTSEVYAISLRDPKLFDQALRATIDGATKGADMFEERKHKGTLIRSMRGLEQSGVSLSYAVTGKWLLLSMGEDQFLNQAIDRMQSDQKSLWDRKDVKSALRDFPDRVSQVEYFDLGQLMEMLEPMIDEMMQDGVEDLDLKSDDLPDFPYFMLGWASYVKRGLISKVTLFPRSSK